MSSDVRPVEFDCSKARPKAWTAIALVIGLGWACDSTPDPSPVPSPSTTPGAVPVVIVPVGSPGRVPVPQPVPGTSGATFAVVLATPPASSTINVTVGYGGKMHRPTLDFEFRYPQNLTLDDDFTNIEIRLLSGTENASSACQWTDLTHSIRLDRDDKVYLANSVARFRTGVWRRLFGTHCPPHGSSSFTTNRILFKLTPDVADPRELWTFVPMEWTFVVR